MLPGQDGSSTACTKGIVCSHATVGDGDVRKDLIDRITDGRFITHRNRIVVYCACCVHALRDVAELTNVFHNAMMSIVIMICVTMAYFDIYVHSMCSFLFPVCLCLVCVCLSQHMCVMCVCVSYMYIL